MRRWTLSEIVEAVKSEDDLFQEEFITSDELIRYINKSIREAEAEIHTIYEDYFKKKAAFALVSGTSQYSLPTDIYANKIRRIMYDNGSLKYDIRKIKDISCIPFIQQSNLLAYDIDITSTGHKIQFYPTPTETSASNIIIHYLKGSNELEDDDDECDIPEFINFVINRTVLACLMKEHHASVPEWAALVEQERARMINTLTARIPDEDNKIPMDLDFYYDSNDDEL